jgi:non-specific serine/threonine protein kinase
MREAAYLLFYPFFLCELASAMQSMGRFSEGLNEVGNAFRFSQEKGYQWMMPELLRKKGEILKDQGLSQPSLVETLFRQAMRQASAQDAIYWQIAAAISLVESLNNDGAKESARTILLSIYERFSEGLTSKKLLRAKIIIDGGV